MHDPRVGRFFAVDPLAYQYPWNSPYAFSENKVIASLELEGLESVDLNTGEIIKMPNMIELEKLSSNDYGFWRDMLKWEKSTEYTDFFNAAKKNNFLYRQSMTAAQGTELNTDYYAVTISKLPDGMSASDLYDHIRGKFGDYMDETIAVLDNTFNSGTKEIWESNNPLGALMTFNNIADDAPVIASNVGDNYWVFTPLNTYWDANHPLAGHRQFGLTDNEDGTYTFYTRGTDRLYGGWDVLYNALEEGGKFFNQADKLWNGVMDNVSEEINDKGGESSKTHNFTRRINWEDDVAPEDKDKG